MTQTKKKAKAKKRRVVFSASTGDSPPVVENSRDEKLRAQQAALGALAKSMIAGLEREDQQTWEINKKFEDAPMVQGSTVWHSHR